MGFFRRGRTASTVTAECDRCEVEHETMQFTAVDAELEVLAAGWKRYEVTKGGSGGRWVERVWWFCPGCADGCEKEWGSRVDEGSEGYRRKETP